MSSHETKVEIDFEYLISRRFRRAFDRAIPEKTVEEKIVDLLLKSGRELESARSCIRTARDRLTDLNKSNVLTTKRFTPAEKREVINSKIVRVISSLRSCHINLQNALGLPLGNPSAYLGKRLENEFEELARIAEEVLKIEKDMESILEAIYRFARKHKIAELPTNGIKVADKYMFPLRANTPISASIDMSPLSPAKPALVVLRR